MPSLAEFQHDFAVALFAPAAAGTGEAGLLVHRNTVIKALVDAVLANYPTVGVLMGENWLVDMARAFALQHPPRHAVLAAYGEAFPEFLRAMDVARDWPYLPGVAALDRAWTESQLAPDQPVLTPERLSGLDPEALGSLRLRLHPSAHYGVYAGSAVTVWRANRPPATAPAELHIDGCEEAALMVRNEDGVTLLPLDAVGRAFVAAILADCCIGEAGTAALQAAPDGDLGGSWSVLLAHGVFAAIDNQGD
jgi:hypothetical protein